MTCIKYVVFFVNFLFFVVGCAAVGLGIYALVDKNDMEALTKIDSDGKLEDFNARGLLQNGAIVLIVGGACLLVLGFLGCCGAVKEVKCLLALYAGFIILILIVQVVAAGLAIAFRSRIEDKLQEGLQKALLDYYDGMHNSSDTFSRAWDFAQVEFGCCGVNSTADFMYTKWYNSTRSPAGTTQGPKVPPTCCELKNKDAVLEDNKAPELKDSTCQNKDPADTNPFTSVPCYEKIRDWLLNRAAIIIGIAFGIVAIEILAVVFACCLYRSIDS